MKKLIMLAMMLGLLVSGCASSKIFTTPCQGWEKEGSTPYQLNRDIKECRGPEYIKPDMTNYETDHGFCENEAIIRDAHKKNICSGLSIPAMIPGICLIAAPAWAITCLSIPNSDICGRCMKDKGYEKNTQKSEDVPKCMESKGYQWEVSK